MDGVTTTFFSNSNNLFDIQIRLANIVTGEFERFISQGRMQSALVSLGINRYRRDTQRLGRPDNPNGYFTSICDQQLTKHGPE